MNFFQNAFKKSPIQFVQADEKRLSNRLLSYSLMWLSLGIFLIAILSFAILAISPIREAYFRLIFGVSRSAIGLLVTNLVLTFASIGIMLFISNQSRRQNSSLAVLVPMYILFIILESFWLPALISALFLIRTIDDNFSFVVESLDHKTISYVLLAFTIPAGVFAIIGALGWYQIVDFSRFVIFIWVGLAVELILFIVSYFIFNSIVNAIYLVIATLVTFAMIGYNFWLMRQESLYWLATDKYNEDLKAKFLRIGLAYGMFLLVSYLRLVIILLKLFSRR